MYAVTTLHVDEVFDSPLPGDPLIRLQVFLLTDVTPGFAIQLNDVNITTSIPGIYYRVDPYR
eukprot:UN16368